MADVMLPPLDYENTVIVAKSGGDFDVIQDAIDSITDNATDKRYSVIIYPGTYTENVVMKNYVSLVGLDHKSTKIISASGTTVTVPPGPASDASIINLKIESTPTSGTTAECLHMEDGELDVYSCYLKMTSATNGVKGSLLDQNGGELELNHCRLIYEMTGTSVGTTTHNVLDLDGDSIIDCRDCYINAKIEDVDDNLKIIDNNSTSTSNSVWSDNQMHGELTNTSASGVSNIFEITSGSNETVIKNCYITNNASGGTNTAQGIIMELDSTAGGAKIETFGCLIENEGFTGDSDVYKCAAGDLIIIRNNAEFYVGDLFEGGTPNERFDILPFYVNAVSEGTSTTTATSYQDKTSLTITPNSSTNEVWRIRAGAEVTGDTAGMIVQTRFRDTTNSTSLNVDNKEITTALVNGDMMVMMEEEVTLVANTPRTFIMQWRSDNVANTAEIRRGRIYATRIS